MKHLILISLLAFSGSAFASNTGGNGPDQNGEAVPEFSKRLISWNEVQEKVIGKCMADVLWDWTYILLGEDKARDLENYVDKYYFQHSSLNKRGIAIGKIEDVVRAPRKYQGFYFALFYNIERHTLEHNKNIVVNCYEPYCNENLHRNYLTGFINKSGEFIEADIPKVITNKLGPVASDPFGKNNTYLIDPSTINFNYSYDQTKNLNVATSVSKAKLGIEFPQKDYVDCLKSGIREIPTWDGLKP